MNVWNFTGNLGKNCEVRHQPNGDAICSFSVAVTSGYGDKKKTTWANCVLFGKAASGNLPQYLTQGTSVAVSGEVTLDEWEKDGVKNKSLKVKVINVDLIGSSQQKQEPAQNNQPKTLDSFDDETLPF